MLLEKPGPARPGAVVPRPQRLARRLDEATVRQVVEAYEAGATARQLAEQFGVARSAVVNLLRNQGVQIRFPRLTGEQKDEMVELYRAGMSQAESARRLG